MEGNIIAISKIEEYTVLMGWKCPTCAYDGYDQLQEPDEHGQYENFRDWKPMPDICPECSNPHLRITQNTKAELRRVTIQEPVDDNPNPRTIEAYLFGKTVKTIKPSQRARFMCTLRSIKQKKTSTYEPMLDIHRVAIQDDAPIQITDLEKETFKSLSLEDIFSSFCPKMRNVDLLKESIIVSLVGGYDGAHTRGDINLLMVGDPSTGKTELLQEAVKLRRKSDYVSGRSASGAGLLAGVDNMSDGTRAIKFGPVVKCNGGVVGIDEMDKMRIDDTSALHESMSKQTFTLTKIGIDVTMQTKTGILGAANPVGSGRWNDEKTIRENVKLPDSLLSRFGLIILVKDKPNKERDREIIRQMIRAKKGDIQVKIDSDTLKKVIEYARQHHPDFTSEAETRLEDWFLDLRETEQNVDAIAIDHRTYNDLTNIAIAYARLRFCDRVETQDADMAINLLKKTLLSFGMHTPGERSTAISLDRFHNKEGFTEMTFENPISHDQAVMKLMESKFYKDRASAEKAIQILRNTGKLLETEGKYRWVS